MERKVNKLEHSHVEVIATVDEAMWVEAQKKAFTKVASNISVPGFRKGKAPANMLKGKVDPMKVMDEAINALLPVVYQDVVTNEKLRPMGQPKIDVTKLSDKELELKFNIIVAPEVELGAYKDLEIGKVAPEVTDADIEKAVEDTVKQNATLVVKEDAAEKGDTVVIDFVGSIDGVPFEGGAAEGHELELGSNSFIPGFEDQLVGIKAGEKRDINVKFPENYTAELKGKDAVFAINCHEVKAKKMPELNDEFVKELGINGVSTVEELKANKKSMLETQKAQEARNAFIGKVLASLAASSKIDIAPEIIEDQVKSRKADMEKRMDQNGLTLEQYLQILGQKEEDFLAQLREQSVREFTNFLLMNEVARAEKLFVSNDELEAEFAKLGEQYGMPAAEVKKAIGKNVEEFRNNLVMQKVEDCLYNNNK